MSMDTLGDFRRETARLPDDTPLLVVMEDYTITEIDAECECLVYSEDQWQHDCELIPKALPRVEAIVFYPDYGPD